MVKKKVPGLFSWLLGFLFFRRMSWYSTCISILVNHRVWSRTVWDNGRIWPTSKISWWWEVSSPMLVPVRHLWPVQHTCRFSTKHPDQNLGFCFLSNSHNHSYNTKITLTSNHSHIRVHLFKVCTMKSTEELGSLGTSQWRMRRLQMFYWTCDKSLFCWVYPVFVFRFFF